MLSFLTAATTPAVSPIDRPMMIAITASWAVTGSFAATRLRTLSFMRIDSPRSPFSTPPIQAKYCCGHGWSR